MKTLIRLLLVPLAVGSPFVQARVLGEPVSPRTNGKVLLLANEQALEGDIELVADQYHVRRGAGEVTLPSGKALRLCADWNEAYAFMASRANLRDADERLRLARWCHLNGLRAKALEEVNVAVEMRPGHIESKQLQVTLKRVSAGAQTATNVRPPATVGPEAPPPAIDISSDSLTLFTSRVQPILLNACVTCHSRGRGGDFQLHRTYEGGQRLSTQKNLASVLRQVDTGRPELSPLLIKAVSLHGDATQSPLKAGRKSLPFQTLQSWVQSVLENNPHLRENRAMPVQPVAREIQPASVMEAPLPPAPPPRPVPLVVSNTPAPAPVVGAVLPMNPGLNKEERLSSWYTNLVSGAQEARSVPSTPAAPAARPTDPFDPVIFNQQASPQR
jgi:hypothetical protein